MNERVIEAVVESSDDDRTQVSVDCSPQELVKLAQSLGVDPQNAFDDRKGDTGEVGMVMSTEVLANAGISAEGQPIRFVIAGVLGEAESVRVEPGATLDEAKLVTLGGETDADPDALYDVPTWKDNGVVDY